TPVRERPPDLRAEDLRHGHRCLQQCAHYPGVMADFLRHLLAHERPRAFAEEVLARRDAFHRAVAGNPNALRVAGKFRLLAAALGGILAYFVDVWPAAEEVGRRFIAEDLVRQCTDMVGAVREQRASAIFVAVLAGLLQQRRVRVDRDPNSYRSASDSSPLIG